MSRASMRYILAVTAFLALGLLLGGCGGIIDDDNGLDLGDPQYPQYKDLTIILQVRDPDGWPVGGATITVDGTDDLVTTDDQFHPLGDGYPVEWLGWLANWVSDFYQVVMNYAGDVDEFTIEVTKDGWTTDRSVVQIFDYEPEHIFIRDRMVIAPVGVAQTSAVSAPHPALVVGGAAPVSPQSVHPRIIIQSTDD